MTKSVNERLTFILTSEMDVPPEKIMPSATFQSLGFDSMRQIDFALLVEMEFPQIDVDQHPFDKLITLGELEFEIDRVKARAAPAPLDAGELASEIP
jgi:acyl carrier protein